MADGIDTRDAPRYVVSPSRLLVAAVVVEGGVFAVAVILGMALRRSPLEQFHLDWRVAAAGIAGAGPPLLALAAASRVRWAPVVRFRDTVEALVAVLFAGAGWFHLVLISALAGVGEEALFRGVVQGWLVDAVGTWPGVLAASALFGLAHLVTPAYAVVAGVVGLYLGAMAVAFDGLLAPAITHAVYDLGALLYILRRVRRHPKRGADGGGDQGIER